MINDTKHMKVALHWYQILAKRTRSMLKRNWVCFIIIQGVLRDQMDVDRLGEKFKERYSAKKADPFDEDGWEAPEQRLVGSKFVITWTDLF